MLLGRFAHPISFPSLADAEIHLLPSKSNARKSVSDLEGTGRSLINFSAPGAIRRQVCHFEILAARLLPERLLTAHQFCDNPRNSLYRGSSK